MKSHSKLLLRILSAVLIALCVLVSPQVLRADKLQMKDGSQVDGIIDKVENGQVTVNVSGQMKVFNILDVTRMDFDNLRLPAGASKLPLQHFLSDMESQEIVGHVQDVEKAAADVRTLVDQDKKKWSGQRIIPARDLPAWQADQEKLRRALSRYQEVLGDFYFHVVGKVDEYNRLAKEGNQIRVKGQGPLVTNEMERFSVKKYVPTNWYDTIFYSGYDLGYTQGFYGARPQQMVSPQ
ncbi:MAG TPA: hypothetical protein VNI36_05015 [Candidatus Dormibacteraeota bacterium]|nr:hypothetical protein [Candidatus Dormibacteraeota bacterium]